MHGGYREGSGRSKCGYYKGIYCGSTYELCWVIYHLDHNIPFERFKGYLTDGKRRYYPDFLTDAKSIVEIKGYHTPEVDEKTKIAEDKGYKVQILYKDDLTHIFEYVKKQYNIPTKTKFDTLYDGYRPKFKFNCNFCKKDYETDTKPRASISYCSRICAGKARYQMNIANPGTKLKMSKPPRPLKLTEAQVKEIFFSTERPETLALKFNVNKSMIYHIKEKRAHKKILENL